MSTRSSPLPLASRAGGNRRLYIPILFFLTGMAVPLALGAVSVEKPGFTPLGRIGTHPLLPNSLVFQQGSETIVLTYKASASPVNVGPVTCLGAIYAAPLRDVLQDLQIPADRAPEEPGGTPSRNAGPRGASEKGRARGAGGSAGPAR